MTTKCSCQLSGEAGQSGMSGKRLHLFYQDDNTYLLWQDPSQSFLLNCVQQSTLVTLTSLCLDTGSCDQATVTGRGLPQLPKAQD